MPGSPFHAVVETWRDVRAASGRLEKRDRMARLFASLPADDLRLAADYLSGDLGRDAPGVGYALVYEAVAAAAPAAEPSLSLADIDAAVVELGAASGPGATKLRSTILGRLFGASTALEAEFLASLLLGELRQGALRSLVVDALARALGADVDPLRRAVMFAGALGPVVEAVRSDGASALDRFQIAPLTPIEPMLASPAGDLGAALGDLGGRAAAEWKLDGVRVQVHRQGDEVRVFTRALRDVTASSPELAAAARAVPARSFILDGEAVAAAGDGRPMMFQDLMSRFQQEEVGPAGLTAMFFDLLYLDGEPWVDRPDRERRAALERLLPPERCIPRALVASVAEIEACLTEARREGHEGLVLKSLDAPYAAGRRGANWRKVKPAHTVDLVILAAEWGHGRRQGLLSNLHLGARDPVDPERFWMLGKTFKGLTDAMLRELTEGLQKIAVEAGSHVVRVRPERVVEIAFDGVQRSSRYDSGLALRFARVKRFRPDKRAVDATTLDEVRSLGG
jgi:DNA ligase 1